MLTHKEFDKLLLKLYNIDDALIREVTSGGHYRALMDPYCGEYSKFDNEKRVEILVRFQKHGIDIKTLRDVACVVLTKYRYPKEQAESDIDAGIRMIMDYVLKKAAYAQA